MILFHILILFVNFITIRAWGSEAHSEIGRITNLALSKFSSRSEARARSKTGDLVDTANFGHEEMKKFPELAVYGKQPMIPRFQCGILENKLPSEVDLKNPCQTSADQSYKSYDCLLALGYYLYRHYTFESSLQYHDDPRTEIGDIPLLISKWPMDRQETKNKLRWLLSAVADMHQPILMGGSEFEYGAILQVEYEGKKYSLQQLFESILPGEIAKKSSRNTLSL